MPTRTLILVFGSWLLLAVLSWVAYRFNRSQSKD